MLQHHLEPPEPADTTGCLHGSRQQMHDQGATRRPLADAWISDGLLKEAIAVWSRLYHRPISEEEAMAMLKNIKQAGEVIYRVAREQQLV